MRSWMIVLVLSGPLWAQGILTPILTGAGIATNPPIARNGLCSAAASSCTLSATAANSLILCFAAKTTGITPPGTPTGFTLITTVATTSGGTVGAAMLAWKKAANSGDKGPFASSGATVSTCASYANAVGPGVNSTGQAKTSTTISFNTPGAFTNADNTSWVFAGAVASGAAPGNPTGLTGYDAGAGAGPFVQGYDSNATASSYSTQTLTVSSETWLTILVEVKQH